MLGVDEWKESLNSLSLGGVWGSKLNFIFYQHWDEQKRTIMEKSTESCVEINSVNCKRIKVSSFD